MLGTQHLWLFVVSGLLLNITPGQDTLYIVTRSVAQGRAAGWWSVLGIASVLNPKVALFFLAFLPQFVAPDAASRVTAFLFLGAVFVGLGARLALSK